MPSWAAMVELMHIRNYAITFKAVYMQLIQSLSLHRGSSDVIAYIFYDCVKILYLTTQVKSL